MKQFFYALLAPGLFAGCSYSNRQVAELPFHYRHNLYLSCGLRDSIKGEFMFDTGAYGLHIDSLFNRRPGMQLNKQVAYTNSAPCGQAQFDSPLQFHAGGIGYYPSNVGFVDAKASFGRRCDGIIGWDLFADRVIQINYKKKILTVFAGEDFEPEPGYTAIPMKLQDNKLLVNLSVAVSDHINIKGDYLLDLGFGGSIFFTKQSMDAYGLDILRQKKIDFAREQGTLYTRRSYGCILQARAIELDTLLLKQPVIECSKDETGVLAAGDYVGLLGNRALEHFDVVIDLVKMMLYLKPNEDYSKPMEFNNIGIGFNDRTDLCDGLMVCSVYSGVPNPGIMCGDIVTHVNGQAVKNDPERFMDEMQAITGKPVTLLLHRSGKTMQFNLLAKKEF